MHIGPHTVDPPLILAPMAGITDRPFRQLCRQQGAGLAVSEMVHSDMSLWGTTKSRLRLDQDGEIGPRSVQIAGYDPEMMAEAARAAVDLGAQIIDINMGCPARKVVNRSAGAALLADPPRVAQILAAVVAAVPVPVTLKIRLGVDRDHINAPDIARLARDHGIRALTVHGRTRACGFKGTVDYQAIARVRQAVDIPIIANGDIRTPEQARRVLEITGADALMIGRGAQGRPWLFRQIQHYLTHGEHLPDPTPAQVHALLQAHLSHMYDFYGESLGVRTARKHIGWYLDGRPGAADWRPRILRAPDRATQQQLITRYFQSLPQGEEIAA
ncbi:tRNA dihydrouridine synthase DusB [Ectothiorhodospira shaposhnikovii]|uniref:tRNA dihydrouridine synthase DusB n=1 Tax=Ectothiorhodospira shaposhnikovii TaxID=1054 RepID=UPI001EE81A27|nr:tRNA dihydrouridine synthase DusB [Ectothiorhodospira shaposhnikovii]MCG5512174.1 tRNA dihydrouridine synthase DusB [Ectothiorhodospira shaposhnikovii]